MFYGHQRRAHDFFYEDEFAAITLLNREGYALRPRVIYMWSDSVKIIGAYDYFKGSDKTTYGLLERNKSLYSELRWYF